MTEPSRRRRPPALYPTFFRLVLCRLPAEAAHRLAFGAIRAVAALPGIRHLVARILAPHDPALRVRAFGLELPGPLGLAAGFDKDAHGVFALAALGFDFVEVGTVTAEPQPGNPRPRLFRLPADHALVNRMGFNNAGATAVARRLERHPGRTPLVGVNIGKTKAVPDADAEADYATAARHLAAAAGYLVVNVSSPNTPGLRDLQAVERLRPLLTGVVQAAGEAARRTVPLLVKISPDLSDDDVDAVADLAVELRLDGIIATNTTTSRDGLVSPPATIEEAGPGGLSGAPLKARSLAVLRRLRTRVGPELVLISVGGVETGAEVWERIRAGATLVQAYTGFIYGGPFWARRVHRELGREVRAAGFSSLTEATGQDPW